MDASQRCFAAAILTLLVGVALCQVPKDCPPLGEFGYPNEKSCDLYYRCTNGTFTEEQCPNGLLFAGHPSVFDFCNYNWAVDCPDKALIPPPISSPGCLYQFGLYPTDGCTQYIRCEWGYPNVTDCEPGLAYEDKIHKCNWPDEVEGCDSEAIVGFKCPDKVTGPASKFFPFPRYPHPTDCTRLITCVNGLPRLIGCGEGSAFNLDSYSCDDIENVPNCKPHYVLKK